MLRVFLIVLSLSILLFAYPVWRMGDWLQLSLSANLAFTIPIFLSQFIARFGLRKNRSNFAFVLRHIADFLLGLSPIVLLMVLAAEIGVLIFGWQGVNVATTILAATVALSVLGVVKAWRPKIVTVPLSSRRLSKPVRFVQISDVHIGSRTSRYLDSIMQTVVDLDPDFLCITGDFIDQPGVSVDKLRALTSFSSPIYYCTGNHEHYEDLDDIIDRLQSLGVEVLRNRSVEVDGLQIIGIDDSSDSEQVAKILPDLDIRDDLYSILLYHRPRGLEAAHEHGVDLKLSGHTHNGQIVPFNLAVGRVFEYTRGLYTYKNTHLYVNEGSGTWGPVLRIGTKSEITLFELSAA